METNRFSPTDQQSNTKLSSNRSPGTGKPLPPFVRFGFRPMARAINPLVLVVAGRRHMGLVVELSHYGRRSGRRYATPVAARLIGDQVWIPLTFGTGSDWCRNILATGTCEVRVSGATYALRGPMVVSLGDARPIVRSSFSPIQLVMLRLIGVKAFIRLNLAPEIT